MIAVNWEKIRLYTPFQIRKLDSLASILEHLKNVIRLKELLFGYDSYNLEDE